MIQFFQTLWIMLNDNLSMIILLLCLAVLELNYYIKMHWFRQQIATVNHKCNMIHSKYIDMRKSVEHLELSAKRTAARRPGSSSVTINKLRKDTDRETGS